MASNGKKRTTFAKLNRENAVRERRQIKQARKAARKQAAEKGVDAQGVPPADGQQPG